MVQVAERLNVIENGMGGPIHPSSAGPAAECTPAERTVISGCLESARLFALAESSRAPLPERFPRLTFLAIALVLLISALTAEFEYLRVAGYSWP